jgi:hypothetical protein
MTLLLSAIAITSCNKDGVYNPKEKISKIYKDYGVGKQLAEKWNWDGKQLKTIDHYNVLGGLQYAEIFTYNKKNQVIKVENSEYNEYTEYIYNSHNRLYQARYFEGDENTITYTFEYDDNELSELVIVTDKSRSAIAKNIANPLKYVLPELSMVTTEKMLNNIPAERAGLRLELDIDWIGKNVSEIEVESGNYTEKYQFKYDDKVNPFQNFFSLNIEDSYTNYNVFANKNNVTEVTMTNTFMGMSYSDTEYIYYTYDGNFPVTKNYDNVTEYYEYQ